MKLIIAEKPSLAMNVVKSIGNMNKHDGYFENQYYIITFAFGHLLQLFDVDDYFNREKTRWSLGELPFIPESFRFKLRDDGGVRKQYEIIRSLIKRNDISEIVNCGDADREGEVIINNIITRIFHQENIKKPVKRLWLPEQTTQTIRNELRNLKDDEEYKNLYDEGLARTYLDWTYGINLTRYLSIKSKSFLPVGRVLIPIVKFVYDRDKAIENFKPETYFEIGAIINKNNLQIKAKLKDRHFSADERNKADALLNSLKDKKAVVSKVKKRTVKRQPPKLFSLDTIQNKMFRQYKMALDDTLKHLQKLYEGGYTTYPRTNTEYLADTEKGKIKQVIAAVKEKFNVDIGFKDKKSIFNSSKVESHSAITPTIKIPDEGHLSEGERKVYNSIKNRFISNFLNEETIIEETRVLIKIGDESIELKGNVIKQQGFLKYEKLKKDNELPEFIEGEELDTKLSVDEKQTQKPKNVTESELNNFLKNPFKKKEVEELKNSNDDDEYKAILEGCEIGTVATRSGIIKNAKRYEYIKEIKSHLECEEKGIKLIEALEKLKINLDKEKTVEFGKQLKNVYKGNIEINNIVDEVKDELNNIIANGSSIQIDRIYSQKNSKKFKSLGVCPVCNKGKIIVGRTGYGCSRWKEDCKFFIAKTIAGKTISESTAKKLIKNGKTNIIKGFKNRSGKSFDSVLIIKEGKVVFDFSLENRSLGKCPICGKGEITSNKSGYGCSRWKEGCKFFIGKCIAGKNITESMAKKLVKDKKTNLIKGFKSRAGKKFDAALIIDKDGKIVFMFE
ncbi:MAG: DNA topoisomerase [Clostridium tyrobutyricum]|jgi:DNA topoisomerase-3|uniref:type IA DNA topoisomerase n=1 Tax=Clostridium tyrobutyricum TaxID=1519 RepID=UPI0024331380|nr:type IA DNA topoisomerase [Clostridium tyrobutyricum]MCH4200944.1 DNA topoisomerase [Clostridium tyrobutyricum]MCH4238089.1 DNA topoisomerase [Clostridium tyrobutyricum]MCH4258994.1 DNA topoisomerase [Clostridium tyrobutyricum]MCI1239846.1 DNA topoisomerase [Clostridium tyrobutyricum]MCI1653009.1 DNA topoisomerase [Clostridium tyrobutyricum]